MSFTLTSMPPGGRGCGTRKDGGLYLSMGTSPVGIPVWDLLFDPVAPWSGEPFQGIRVDERASEAWTQAFDAPTVVLVDMVSKADYPSVPAFVEEVRRYGISRRIPETFLFDALEGKAVFLVTLHWRADLIWQASDDFKLPAIPYWPCLSVQQSEGTPDGLTDPASHYANCTYHLWPHTLCHHDMDEWHEQVGWHFDPRNVITKGSIWRMADTLDIIEQFPLPEWGPARFAAWPITHIEGVRYVPERAMEHTKEGTLGGLPLAIVED